MPEEDIITARQAIGRVLKEGGVEYIFGVGGDSIFPPEISILTPNQSPAKSFI